MSSTAGSAGQAGPVAGLAGPPGQEAALALAEVAAAGETVTRMKAKVAKAQQQAAELHETAEAGLAQAEADENAAAERAAALLVTSEDAVREAAGQLAAEYRRHAEALAGLAGGEG
jgi:ABC-type hemin transport system substrate-binding protein